MTEYGPVFSDYLNEHFDIVAMNPRGLLESEPSIYNPDWAAKIDKSRAVPRTEEAFQKHIAARQGVAKSCRDDPKADYWCLHESMDVVNVAKDFEAARQHIGDDKISFLGFSWGSAVGYTCAELFPSKVRALVLDGVEDLSSTDLTKPETFRPSAQNTEDFWKYVIEWSDSNNSSALLGMDTARILQEVFERMNRAILEVTCPGDDYLVDGYHQFFQWTQNMQGDHATGFNFEESHLQDLTGNIKYVWTQYQSTPKCNPAERYSDSDEIQNFFDDIRSLAYDCNDLGYLPGEQPNFHEFRALVDSFSQLAPISHAHMEVYTLSACLGWPYHSATRPHRLHFTNHTVLPPVLLVNALHDFATGYAGAVSMHGQLPGSVLLTRNGTGHTSYESDANKTSEATRIMDDYLVNLRLPEPDTVVST